MNEVRFGADPARIGVYGGTFDPVHHGHLIAAAEVCAVLGLDRLVFMPAGRPPHKGDQLISPAAQRVRMLELAISGREQFAISALDLGDDRPSFTAELLARLRATWGERHELFFVMGEDSLRDFPTWREPGRIAEMAQLGVVARPGAEADSNAVVQAVPGLAGRIHLVPIPEMAIASSDLRARVAEGRPIAFQVPGAVEEFIAREGLYRGARVVSRES